MCSDKFLLFWDGSSMQWVSFDLFGVLALLKLRITPTVYQVRVY